MAARVTVVGAGVLGLSCAVRLAETGLEVNVLARDLPRETASSAAGALWLPPVAEPSQDVALWAAQTLAELRRLAADEDADGPSGHGVRIMAGTLLHENPVAPPAGWARRLGPGVRLARVADPAPGYALGYRTELPVLDMPRYLDHLTRRLGAAGGTLTRMPLPALPTRGLVVNCTGVAARALAEDPRLRPVRGQSVIVADPGGTRWWWDDAPQTHTYVLPRAGSSGSGEVVIGGTLEDSWDTAVDDATATLLLERAARLVPELRGARVLGHRVGLRPARPAIRVETEHRPTADDPYHARVHCYGHGRGGVTLSWGSAAAVTDAVTRVLPRPKSPRLTPAG
jgi:D-amino-acid oxidase